MSFKGVRMSIDLLSQGCEFSESFLRRCTLGDGGVNLCVKALKFRANVRVFESGGLVHVGESVDCITQPRQVASGLEMVDT
jgi:hypothetical protein